MFKNLTDRNRAFSELLLAAVIWGFGFVATIWALKDFSVVGFLVMRFLIACFIGETTRVFIFKRKFWDKQDFKLSIFSGILMAGFLLPQTLGLMFTTATNSGFLTILYVVLVPVLSFVIWKKKYPPAIYFLAVLAFIGAWFLMKAEIHALNKGDLWTLLCAFVASLHILYLGKVAPGVHDAFRFNNFQSFWCLLIVTPFAAWDPNYSMTSTNVLPWVGLLSCAIGSSLIGFMIQIRAQKVLSDTTAAQFFLLESPFALLFGCLLLGDTVNAIQAVGAFLILLSSYLTLKVEARADAKALKSV